MMFANVGDDRHVEAYRGARGTCPTCDSPVIAKAGEIVAHHWAHEARAECDPWAEPIGPWHLSWQRLAPADRREVVIGSHRADLVSPGGWVVELQHSGISPAVIRARESYYGPRMMWIFDARDAYDAGRLELRRSKGDKHVTFRWRQPRKSVAACRRRVLLHLSDRLPLLLDVRKMHPSRPCGGWGYTLPAAAVRDWITSWEAAAPPVEVSA